VLHTDVSLLPRRRLAWASWNYLIPREKQSTVAITYNMNILQSLDAPQPFCVTLNHSEAVAPETVLQRFRYHHPVYTPAGVAAQQHYDRISGVNNTYFCGAYWGYGFHEDGVNSALAVCRHFGKGL
jgi:predicted NAD/FAD-binding protein